MGLTDSLSLFLVGGGQSVVRLFVRMGFRSRDMDPEVIGTVASIYFDRDDATLTKGVRLQVGRQAIVGWACLLDGWSVCLSVSGVLRASAGP